MLVTVSLSSHSAPYSFEYTGSSSSLKIDLLIVNTIVIIIVNTIVTATLIKIDIVTTIVNTIVTAIVINIDIVIVTWVVMGVLLDTDSIDNHNRLSWVGRGIFIYDSSMLYYAMADTAAVRTWSSCELPC